MKSFVDDLVTIVGGSANGAKKVFHAEVMVPSAVTNRAFAAPATIAKRKEVAVLNASEVNPEQVIPMEDDFKDF